MAVVVFVQRLFVYMRVIQTNKVYMISDKKSNKWSSICCRIEVISILVTMVIVGFMLHKQSRPLIKSLN